MRWPAVGNGTGSLMGNEDTVDTNRQYSMTAWRVHRVPPEHGQLTRTAQPGIYNTARMGHPAVSIRCMRR
jgi:hypothetical protein